MMAMKSIKLRKAARIRKREESEKKMSRRSDAKEKRLNEESSAMRNCKE